MFSTLTVAGRTVVKRLAADWLIAGAAFTTVLLAIVLLASGPIYADAVTISALQRSLAETPVEETNLGVSLNVFPEFYGAADDVVRRTVDQTMAATGADVFAHLEADAYELRDRSSDGAAVLASIHYFEGIENEATVTTGRWPEAGTQVEVAVFSPAARELALAVGDTLTVTNRRDPALGIDLRIVGFYEIDDPGDAYWLNDPLSLTGQVESTSFLSYGPFVTREQSLLDSLTPLRANADWRVLPRFENLAVPEVDSFRANVAGLADDLDDELFARVDPGASGAASGFTVDTELPNLLTDVDRSLTVTRSSVLALLVQLALLAGYALVLTAGLLVDTRRTETNLVRSRGTSPRQVLGVSVLEGLALTIPAIVAGPYLASLLLRALNRVGPLATVQLTIDPLPNTESYLLAGIAAALAIVALAWPAYRSARRFGSSGTVSERQTSRSAGQRLGIDLALLALALIVFWQLQTLGPEVSARVRGQFGVDPLLVVAPALALLAGAILALRMIPLLARVAEWLASSGRSTVRALASWQVARRPVRYARSALLLMLAIGIGFFAASYSTTWIVSQEDQAGFAVGADITVLPDRATGSSIGDLQLPSIHRSLPGVDNSTPVDRLTGQLGGGGGLVDVMLLDSTRAADIVEIRADLSPDFPELMDVLSGARPNMAGVTLPGRPTELGLEVEAIEELPEEEELEQCGPDPIGPETCFNARVRIVVQDGDGLLHRIGGQHLSENEGPQTLDAPLTLPDVDGGEPVYPLSLVSIEIESQLAATQSRSVDIVFGGITVTDADGTESEVSTRLDWNDWEVGLTQVVGSFVRPDIAPGPANGEMITAAIETGAGFNVAPTYFTLRPSGTTLPDTFPVIVSETFPEKAFVTVGEAVRLPPLRIARDEVVVAGTIESFPTVDAEEREVVLADLATYQMMGYEPGRGLPPVDGFWLATDGAGDREVVASLRAAPLNSFDVVSRQTRADTLLSDPVALGTIGALTVGFVAAAVFAAVGFAVSATVSARERLVEFALLRAVGLSPRQLGRWLILEQGALVVVSLALGTLIGIILTASILPLVTLTQSGGPAVPDVIVIYPWGAVLGLELAVVAVLGLIVAVMAILLRRIGLGSLLRLGED